MDDIKEIKQDVKDIQKTLVENTIKLGVYNEQLIIHIEGVKDLQSRIKPIESHVEFIRSLGRVMAWGAGIAAGIATVARLFL